MAHSSFPTSWLAASAAAVAVPGAVPAQDGAFDRTPVDCIIVQTITRTDAVDDQNLIFYMLGGRAYRNHLPQKCPGLERENRIGYAARGGRLCRADTITVLEQWGVGLQTGFTCRLSEFVPLSETEIEDLKVRDREGAPRGRGISARPVEIDEAADDTPSPPPAAAEPAEQPEGDGAR